MTYPYESVAINEELPMFMIMTSVKYIPLHWHDRIEFVYVLKGSVRTFVEKNEYALCENDLLLINNNEVHGVESTEVNKLIVLQIPISYIKNFYENIEDEYFECKSFQKEHQEEFKEIRSSIINLLITLKNRGPFYKIKINSLLLDIIHQLMTKFRAEPKKTFREKSEKDFERLNRIIHYIQNNFMHPLTLNEIAEIEQLTVPYLSRYFHQHIGQSFQKYLNSIRLEHAIRSLVETKWPVIQVAMESGFSNLNTFHKLFKDKFQTTPHKYRLKYQHEMISHQTITHDYRTSYQFDEENDLEDLHKFLS